MPAEAAEHILEEELKGYKELLALLQRERTCLLGLETEAFCSLAKEKDTLVMKLRLLDEERQRIVKRQYGNDMNLQRIAAETGNRRLLDIRSTFLSLVQSIDELNNLNRLLIDRSLDYLKGTTRFLSTSGMGCPGDKGVLYSGEA